MVPRCGVRILVTITVAVLVVPWILSSDGTASAATKPDPQAVAVQKTLAKEASGSAIARDKQLAGLIESAPDYARARWAAGYVEIDGKWLKFNELTESEAESEKLAEYRRLRTDTADTAEGNLKLANWCYQQRLKEQERAHLLRVLHFEPNRADLRERLGMLQVGGAWTSPREARRAAARGKQAIADLKHWLPTVERFRSVLAGAAGRTRDLAAEHVREIRDPSAIVALETVLALSSDEAGAAVVDALAAMKRPEAAIALARLAAFSESSETSDAARAKLKTLPKDHFVPPMLSSLVVPGTMQTMMLSDRYGRLLFHQAFVYEGADRKSLAVFDNVYRIRSGNYGIGTDAVLAASAAGSTVAAGRTLAAEAQKSRIERTNSRIIDVLRETTGQNLSADPNAWWKWWNDVNEVVPEGEKPTEVVYVVEQQVVPTREWVSASCLVAGTPIWTDRGLVAVDKMRIGDRVLAQDPMSGELAYKAVLRTTVRPCTELVHISLADETVVASGGHPFWVAGRGWVHARSLQPGSLLHTVTGSTPVKSITINDSAPRSVYNLVVEDFHDYFAGDSHLLLHDTTPREPTLGPVPGWQE